LCARWLVTNAGVELADAHAALADAEATAALLAAYMRTSGERRMWDEWLAFGETIAWSVNRDRALGDSFSAVSLGSRLRASELADDAVAVSISVPVVFRVRTLDIVAISGGDSVLAVFESRIQRGCSCRCRLRLSDNGSGRCRLRLSGNGSGRCRLSDNGSGRCRLRLSGNGSGRCRLRYRGGFRCRGLR
jgi:hypothetical protein